MRDYSIVPIEHLHFKTDYIEHLLSALKVLAEIAFQPSKQAAHHTSRNQYSVLALTTNKNFHFDDGREYDHKKKEWSKPAYQYVCSVFDYRSDVSSSDKIYEDYDHDAMCQDVRRLLTGSRLAKLNKQFLEECGEGYHYGFNSDDGSVVTGYRITQRPNGGWCNLDISLCHIYYGK